MTDKYSVAIHNQILKPKINWNKKLSILMHEETLASVSIFCIKCVSDAKSFLKSQVNFRVREITYDIQVPQANYISSI